MTGIISLSSS